MISSGAMFAAALLLTGCATLGSPAELLFQASNAVDWSQTIDVARNPGCYWEEDSAWSIGAHPSERSVAIAWAVEAGAHLAVSAWLERTADATGLERWRAAQAAWQIVTISLSAANVVRNAEHGLRPFGGARTQCIQRELGPEHASPGRGSR